VERGTHVGHRAVGGCDEERLVDRAAAEGSDAHDLAGGGSEDREPSGQRCGEGRRRGRVTGAGQLLDEVRVAVGPAPRPLDEPRVRLRPEQRGELGANLLAAQAAKVEPLGPRLAAELGQPVRCLVVEVVAP
jgi:hypothetical protein